MDLPEGDEKDIFLLALARLSDDCQPGTLTPECPFFVKTDKGVACGEQCQDLLAEQGRTVPGSSGLPLGTDMFAHRIRRPRARRGPQPDERPFDAAEAALVEAGMPYRSRSTPALMTRLRERFMEPPWVASEPVARSQEIRAILDVLGERGIEPDRIVRDGLATIIAGALAVALCLRDLVDDADGNLEHIPAGMLLPPEDWLVAVLGDVDPEEDRRARAHRVLGQSPRLLRWVDEAPLEDLIDMTAPRRLPQGEPRGLHEREVGVWLVDRFCETYLAEWHRLSLGLEWNYLHSFQTGCCPPQVMAERRVSQPDLAVAIADLAVAEWSDEEDEQEDAVRVDRFTPIAIEQLRSGDRASALAIYELLVDMQPTSSVAQNNFGFCLIPDDPARALEHLETAERLGYEDAVNLANQILCLRLLGRSDEAAAKAESLLTDVDPHQTGYLWEPHDGELRFQGPISVIHYVERLVDDHFDSRAVGPEDLRQ
ncbi:MAG: hypothetical protein U0R76_16750 [Candidatus Nanopelagicales bacterium]